MERRGPAEATGGRGQPRRREEPKPRVKSFDIDKWEVWEAYRRVRANRGEAGVDGQTLEEFEQDLRGNLYKLWNRMSSGSYLPPRVRRVEIPKADGGTRPLGIPTVADRIAQMVVTRRLEDKLEPLFHPDSYGYRPNKSAHEAIARARQRCWARDWVLDVDIKAFFDTLDHDLLMRALRKHVTDRWLLLYVERWLKAPVELAGGTVQARDRGTPQGGVISPLLANLFLHYAFDAWVRREMPNMWFERYADDIVCHCNSWKQANWLRHRLEERFRACGLALHPQKTKIVYCRDEKRTLDYPDVRFDFLGYEFRPRRVKRRGGRYTLGFVPAISGKAGRRIRQAIRRWRFRRHTHWSLAEVARYWNPVLRGWLTYYGRFYRSRLQQVLGHFDRHLAGWLASKWDVRPRSSRVVRSLQRLRQEAPGLFVHWQWFRNRSNGLASVGAG